VRIDGAGEKIIKYNIPELYRCSTHHIIIRYTWSGAGGEVKTIFGQLSRFAVIILYCCRIIIVRAYVKTTPVNHSPVMRLMTYYYNYLDLQLVVVCSCTRRPRVTMVNTSNHRIVFVGVRGGVILQVFNSL